MITKEMFDSLSSDEITKKRYDEIIKLITDRVNVIWRFICLDSNRKLDWYDFDNCRSGDDGHDGWFDENEYKEFISLTGNYNQCPHNSIFYDGFPTKYLWDNDFEATVCKELEKAKKLLEKAKKKHKESLSNKQRKAEEIKESIKKKLTEEELKHVTFS